jgi:hypothetical protein
VAVYVGLLVVFTFIFIPMIGINPVSPHFFFYFKFELYDLSYGIPFVALGFSFLLEIPLLFLSDFLSFSSFSSELSQMVSFSFPVLLGAFSAIIFRWNMVRWDMVDTNYQVKFQLHIAFGFCIALIGMAVVKRLWNKTFLIWLFKKIKLWNSQRSGLSFSRLEYEEAQNSLIYDWSCPLHSMMSILAFVIVTKWVSPFSCLFGLVAIFFIWVIDRFCFQRIKVKIQTMMISKCFFHILDVSIIMIGIGNGLVPLLSARGNALFFQYYFNENWDSFSIIDQIPIFAIVWLIVVIIWIYLDHFWGCKLTCFDFKPTKRGEIHFMERTKLQFLPEKIRERVMKIDRNEQLSK